MVADLGNLAVRLSHEAPTGLDVLLTKPDLMVIAFNHANVSCPTVFERWREG
jgi:hypothetical protein